MENTEQLIAQIQELVAVYGLNVIAALAILFFRTHRCRLG